MLIDKNQMKKGKTFTSVIYDDLLTDAHEARVSALAEPLLDHCSQKEASDESWKNYKWKNDPIVDVCNSLASFLQEKNKNYGNSVSEPTRVFSKADTDEAFFVRMDDKLSRIKNAPTLRRNDVVDLMGYLVLYCSTHGWTNFDDMID